MAVWVGILLLSLGQPAPPPFETYAHFAQSIVASHTDGSENRWPCMARLSDDRILMVWSQRFANSQEDGIVGAYSPDGGCHWSAPQTLISHDGIIDADPSVVVSGAQVWVTCTSVTFAEGIRTSTTWCVRSENNGGSWSAPYEIPMGHRYTCGKTHHGLRLASGTLIQGYSWDRRCEQGEALQEEGQMDLCASVLRSTDQGQTWISGGDAYASYEKIQGGAVSGTDEPALALLEDGSLYMLMRTGSTHLFQARSYDEGQTWTEIQPSPLVGTNAPAALSSFEVAGKRGLLAVWDHGPERFPLCAAVSLDGGRSWSAPKDIGFPYTGGQASYPSCEQTPDGAFLAVWQQDVPGGRDIRMARFSLGWVLAAPSLQPRTVVLFGESTTAARGPLRIFGQLLEEDLPARGIAPKIVNAGLGGEITDHARERFETDVLAQKPDAVTIYYGLNDAAVNVWQNVTEPRVPVSRFGENLRYFVRTLRERNIQAILMTPNPLAWNAEQRTLYGKPPYRVDDPEGHNIPLEPYVEMVRTVAREENAPLVDVFQMFRDYARAHSYNELLLDGVHPNDFGHRLIADALLPLLAPAAR